MKLLLVCLAVAVLPGCRPRPVDAPPPPVPVELPAPLPVSTWPTVLGDVVRDAQAGRYDDADRRLQAHGLANAGTLEGAEADYWRAVLKADPANPVRTLRERVALLDAYLAVPGAQPERQLEATVMRRLLEQVDSTSAVLVTVRASAEARQRTRDDEIRRLNDELDRTTAELDRIRKRLAGRPPG